MSNQYELVLNESALRPVCKDVVASSTDKKFLAEIAAEAIDSLLRVGGSMESVNYHLRKNYDDTMKYSRDPVKLVSALPQPTRKRASDSDNDEI